MKHSGLRNQNLDLDEVYRILHFLLRRIEIWRAALPKNNVRLPLRTEHVDSYHASNGAMTYKDQVSSACSPRSKKKFVHMCFSTVSTAILWICIDITTSLAWRPIWETYVVESRTVRKMEFELDQSTRRGKQRTDVTCLGMTLQTVRNVLSSREKLANRKRAKKNRAKTRIVKYLSFINMSLLTWLDVRPAISPSFDEWVPETRVLRMIAFKYGLGEHVRCCH